MSSSHVTLSCYILIESRVHRWAGALIDRSFFFFFGLAMGQTGPEGTIGRAEGRDGSRGIKWVSVLSLTWSLDPSCWFKVANHLVWQYPEACLHLELCCLLEGEGAVGAGCPLHPVVQWGVSQSDLCCTSCQYTSTFPDTAGSQGCTQYHHLAITLVFPEVKHLYFLIIYFFLFLFF